MRRRIPLVLALLAALVSGGSTTAVAAPLPAAAPRVRGWAEAPRSVPAGAVFRAEVRAPGPRRVIVLQRLVRAQWRTVERARENRRGVAVLRWQTPATRDAVVLRAVARATPDRPALRTPRRTVALRPGKGATPRTTTPRTSPSPSSPAPPSTAPTATPTATPAPSPAADPQLARVLVRVNQARSAGATCGGTAFPPVGALTRSDPLDGVAQAYAVRMASENFFSHTAPDGSTPRSRAAAAGLPWPAENIAAGYRTADDVVDGWLASDGHCRNIMDGDYSTVGLGRATSTTATYRVYWVQNFLP